MKTLGIVALLVLSFAGDHALGGVLIHEAASLEPSQNQTSPSQHHRFRRQSHPGHWHFDDLHPSSSTRRFEKRVLKWRISKYPNLNGLTQDEVRQQIKSAMRAWSDVVDVQFEEISGQDSWSNVDIDLKFLDGNYDEESGRRIGPDGLAHFESKGHGRGVRVVFNGNMNWVIGGSAPPSVDLYTVALHQLGHALGLDHSQHEYNQVMSLHFTGRMRGLTPSDIQEVRDMYRRGWTPGGQGPSPYTGGEVGSNQGGHGHGGSGETWARLTGTSGGHGGGSRGGHGGQTHPRGLCTEGRAYCGQELINLGYGQVDTTYLYTCGPGGHASPHRHCQHGCRTLDLDDGCACAAGTWFCKSRFIPDSLPIPAPGRTDGQQAAFMPTVVGCSFYTEVKNLGPLDRYHSYCMNPAATCKQYCTTQRYRNGEWTNDQFYRDTQDGKLATVISS